MKKCYLKYYNKTAIIECINNEKYICKILSIDYNLNIISNKTKLINNDKYFGLVIFNGENIKTIEFK